MFLYSISGTVSSYNKEFSKAKQRTVMSSQTFGPYWRPTYGVDDIVGFQTLPQLMINSTVTKMSPNHN